MRLSAGGSAGETLLTSMEKMMEGTVLKMPPAINKLMRDMWADIEQKRMEREEQQAKADPVKHRLSRIIRGGFRYKYFETKNGRGQRVRFCYSTKRNVAGYFLIWREVWSKKKGERDQWDATTSKDSAIRTARTMWEEAKD